MWLMKLNVYKAHGDNSYFGVIVGVSVLAFIKRVW